MLDLIREETKESVTLAWRDLEVERDCLQELQKKTLPDLHLCQNQVISQTEMVKTTNEEMGRLQEEVV